MPALFVLCLLDQSAAEQGGSPVSASEVNSGIGGNQRKTAGSRFLFHFRAFIVIPVAIVNAR
jgi:hypothetical protein